MTPATVPSVEILPAPPSVGKTARRVRGVLTQFAIRFLINKRHQVIRRTRVAGLDLKILPGVFHPSLYFSSRYFAHVLSEEIDFAGKRVLDLGCGSGILALVAARAGASVVAVDINPEAVRCTQLNAASNGLSDQIDIIESDLFERLSNVGTFDYLITNPPFLEGEPTSAAEFAWKGGADQHFIRTLAQEARRFLHPRGSVLCILSSDGRVAEQVGIFIEAGYAWKLLSSKRFLFERMYVFGFTPTQMK